MTIGTLCVTVVEARKLANKDGFLGKNDPFVTLKIGSKKHKTPVVNNAGSKATWDLTYEFEISNDKESLELECYDFDKFTANDLIGKIKISLQSVCSNRLIECWYPLGKNNQFQGEVNLILEFFPGGTKPIATIYQGTPQSGYPPQLAHSSHPEYSSQVLGYPPQNPGYPPQNPGYLPQSPGYPPQNSGYPSQSPGYPLQNPGFPPQSPGYPPQNSGYPPQNPGYPTQSPGYPHQGSDYPPQNSSYPPHGSGYPPQNPNYSPQGSGYPPL